MYLVIEVAVFAATVFFPSFIALRDRTNSNWRAINS